ncbi:MAG TPA: DNA double-strand break repair nuclease NurA, partial [Phototrophicaceae bacterium]|nr:DNA double-strand break repair nuclease NurA [Phototrophicaceae bacterium]
VQNSPRNLSYRQRGVSYEIAFFYVKVANAFGSAIARVDLPMWVARDEKAVDALHGIILNQCTMQGRTPYPYALTRADELAVVGSKDKAKLDELVRIEMRKKGIMPKVLSAKDQSKHVARSDKRLYELRTDLH